MKDGQIKRLLAPVLAKQESPYKYDEIKGSPVIYGYRNKMEFSFGDERKDGPLVLEDTARRKGIFCTFKCEFLSQAAP